MLNYILRKLLSMIPMLLIITFLIYVGVELMPGDVIDFLIPMDQLAEMTPEEVDAFRAAKGLDGPMVVRYFNWLKGVCRGDLGYSLQNNMPVGTLMMQKLPATIELSLAALFISTVLGILLGVVSAIRKGRLADNLLTVAGMIGVAIPQFLFGVFCIMLFCLRLKWFPVGQRGTEGLLDELHHLFLPAFVLGISMTAGVMRYSRSSMLDSMNRDYVKTARAKGLPEWKVNLLHGFRVACTPVMVLIGFRLPMLISGSIVIENIFQWPGVGRWFTDSVKSQNTPIIMSVGLFMVLLVLLSSLLVDILTAVLDPRVKLS
ncbi:MAG: ABC transporter permease [Oscillospiraceae bacterium]|nr:ABC transporter permease [Oscillospiraceae bacterium]